MRRLRVLLATGTVAILVGGLPAAGAEAASDRPGGRILTLAVANEHGTGELRSVRPDGTGVHAYGRVLIWFASPDYSPDGGRIAYVDGFDIRTMAADGTDDRWLVGAPCGPSSPRWSPDARWIAFESCSDIYQVSTKGYEDGFVNATHNDLNDLQPAWNPSGSRFATATLPGVHVYRAAGSEPRQVSDLPGAVRLDWNPNGRTIAIAAEGDLWLLDLLTGAQRRLTNTPGVIEAHPVWSPDGRWLAFARGPDDPDDPGAALAPKVWLMTATGTRSHSTGVPGIPSSWRFTP
ncbi:TolB family protein [Paractinoplanes atraurantiacus]|uniref:TolB protein n=1 Tax=Paractinoplanes atraurantiacus TaxID=1036182 RepID=A0A285JGS4_9ACTN|nr:PD40 domain-containing protein [Actinoplanes atraurantiacus]SNY59273.1 TolB protein [Actinoplanes atraurantiacus]